jgi:hypothetical protein
MVKSLGLIMPSITPEDFTKNGKTYDIIFDTVRQAFISECNNSLTDSGFYLATVPTTATMLQVLWTAKGAGKKVGLQLQVLDQQARRSKILSF